MSSGCLWCSSTTLAERVARAIATVNEAAGQSPDAIHPQLTGQRARNLLRHGYVLEGGHGPHEGDPYVLVSIRTEDLGGCARPWEPWETFEGTVERVLAREGDPCVLWEIFEGWWKVKKVPA